MANVKTCPMCGQRIATYKHKLNKVLISAAPYIIQKKRMRV